MAQPANNAGTSPSAVCTIISVFLLVSEQLHSSTAAAVSLPCQHWTTTLRTLPVDRWLAWPLVNPAAGISDEDNLAVPVGTHADKFFHEAVAGAASSAYEQLWCGLLAMQRSYAIAAAGLETRRLMWPRIQHGCRRF